MGPLHHNRWYDSQRTRRVDTAGCSGRDDMNRRIFISHGAGRDACVRVVLDNIVPRLRANDYEVFVDVEELRVGDEWNPVLYDEMYRCDAAIVLLGPETVADPRWVRREADVLIGRFKVGGLAAVFPGIVGNVTTAEARKQGFDALLSLQACKQAPGVDTPPEQSDPLQVADRIVAEFSPLGARSGDPGACHWAGRVARYLESARRRSDGSFLDAARRLGLSKAELMHVKARIGAELFLSYRMLSGTLCEELPSAVDLLKPALGLDQLRQLSAEVMPSWVDHEAARSFLPAQAVAGAGDPVACSPLLVFNAFDEWTADQYVRRALCNAPDAYSLGTLERGLPEDDSSAAEALEAACRAALRQIFRVPPRMPLDSRTVRERAGFLNYLVLNGADHDLDDVAVVAASLRRDFHWLVVVVLTGGIEPGFGSGCDGPGRLHEILDTAVVVPPITMEAESAAYQLMKRMNAVVQDSGTPVMSEVS
ncbi:toll/interleukin-1 receptor domain-containing protein [Streptomyces sp. NPDC051109]|uniref:toll/interleukin-1 receptor domain-containing protein n=1 Tax=Streptomyces sp. NPDC051109 TaxID=3365642 RepID=UPI0037B036D7